eukprot:1980976-Pleurochrysis_carterae.AAC.2
MQTISPFSVRTGMSTSQRYLGVIVPFAMTLNVEFRRRLSLTASDACVMQCMHAPVSPSHIVMALAAAIVGIDCMTGA